MPFVEWSDAEIAGMVGMGLRFAAIGLINTPAPGSLSFLDNERFVETATANRNIIGVFATESLARKVRAAAPDVLILVREDPRYSFYSLHNELAQRRDTAAPASDISSDARIHSAAFVAERGVIIGARVVVEPHAAIMPGVEIAADTIIRAGATVGVEGFEHKRTSRGILSVRHDGRVKIGERVEIGANNTVAKGLMGNDTIIGDDTKTDCLVHIGHAARIGKRCLLPACAMIAGSVVMGDDVWIGPNASVSSQVRVGDGAFVTLGSVVTRDVEPNARVTGNFAIDHSTFMTRLKALASANADSPAQSQSER